MLWHTAMSILHSTMPVTINVSSTITPTSRAPSKFSTSTVQIFDFVWGTKEGNKYEELLQSTFNFGSQQLTDIQVAGDNGFFQTVISAYNGHHNLVLKPDDIWIAILTQFNFYVNAHAEDLRSKFVAHEGKKELIVSDVGTRYSVNFGKLAAAFTAKIQEHVVDPELEAWILPDFTTTTFNDTVVCSMLMMSTFKSYFSYGIMLMCGIPNVTLLGVKEDWEKLLARIEKLSSFGEEPAAWESLLRPLLANFVDAFDGNDHVEFWSRICHIESFGSGSDSLCGWITNFCVWDSKGRWVGPRLPLPVDPDGRALLRANHDLSMDDLPPAICDVDVKLDDNGEVFDCIMVAGHVGSEAVGASRDTLAMVPAWFMAIKQKGE